MGLLRRCVNWQRVIWFLKIAACTFLLGLILCLGNWMTQSFIGYAQEPASTPTPWPTVEVPGATHIDATVSKFGMGIGTSLYIIEGETVTDRPFICAVYVQYDTDPIHCEFGDYSLEWTPDIPQ